MLKRLGAIATIVFGVGNFCSCAMAADAIIPISSSSATVKQSLVLDGSLGLSWTDNTFAARTNRQDDGYLIPFLRLTYGIDYDDLSLKFYARAKGERYIDLPADNGLPTVGFTASRPFAGITVGINFDTKFYYNGFFETRAFTAYDFSLFATRRFDLGNGWFATPRMTIANRWADLVTAERALVEGRIDFEYQIDKVWTFLASPVFQYVSFYTAAGTVPRDLVAAPSIALKYDFGHGVDLTTGIAFTARRSNVLERNFEKWDIGPTVAFKVPLL